MDSAEPIGPTVPRIYRAVRATLGRVVRSEEITKEQAIALRLAGGDIVICGGDLKANRALAQEIENAVGPNERQVPHKRAGTHALPHFQPKPRIRAGHTFYETEHKKAAVKP